MKTTIDINDELMQKLLKYTGLKTKKAVVDLALRKLLMLQHQAETLEKLKGIAPDWEGDIRAMRENREYHL